MQSSAKSAVWRARGRPITARRRPRAGTGQPGLDDRSALLLRAETLCYVRRCRSEVPPLLNVPNSLTLFRIFLVPFLVVVLLTKFEGKEIWGVGIFLVAAATDFLDGWLARRRKQVTSLGILLDPIADKLLTSAAFISLVQVQGEIVPAWMVVVIVG